MPELQSSVATIRVAGDELVPAEVTALLGVEPTGAHSKGEKFTIRDRVYEKKIGLWRLSATKTEPGNLDTQVAELLAKTTDDLLVWRELGQRFEIDLFCGWFMGGNNEGIEISVDTMAKLAARGILLSLDIYGPVPYDKGEAACTAEANR